MIHHTCRACSSAVEASDVFCWQCGAFLRGSGPGPRIEIPELPLSKQNPLTQSSSLGSAGAPLPAEEILALRYELSEALDGRPLLGRATQEFTTRVVPLIEGGHAGPTFFRLWLRYVTQLDTHLTLLDSEMRTRSESCSASPAHARLFTLYERDIKRLSDSARSELLEYGPLLRLAVRLNHDWDRLDTAQLRLEFLRSELSFEAAKKTMPTGLAAALLVHSGTPDDLLSLETRVRRAYDESRVSEDDAQNAQLHKRFGFAADSLATVIVDDDGAETYVRDVDVWFTAIRDGLPPKVKNGNDPAVRPPTELRKEIEEIGERRISLLTKRYDEVKELIEHETNKMQRARALPREQAALDATFEAFLKEQQVLRMRSEGKIGLSVFTDIFGARAGTYMEGLFK